MACLAVIGGALYSEPPPKTASLPQLDELSTKGEPSDADRQGPSALSRSAPARAAPPPSESQRFKELCQKRRGWRRSQVRQLTPGHHAPVLEGHELGAPGNEIAHIVGDHDGQA